MPHVRRGAEKVALYLAGGFADKGHETILAVFDAQGALKDQVPPNVELVDFKVTSTGPAMRALRKLIRDRRPDAVNSHQDAVNLAATLVRLLPGPKFQLVTTIHHGLSADYGSEAPEYMKKRFKMMRRFSRFAESYAIVRELFATGESTFHGEYYDIDGALLFPKPVQAGGPPLMIGSYGEKMLELTLPDV